MSSNGKPIVVWGDPPRVGATRGRVPKYLAHVQQLRERPGEWACIVRNPNSSTIGSIAQNLRDGKGYAEAAEPGRLEVRARKTFAGDYGVWARWVPPGGDS